MHRHGIVPAAEAPAVDFPRIDVEAFSQVPLEERWQLMAGALNRLAALEVAVKTAEARLERRMQALELAHATYGTPG